MAPRERSPSPPLRRGLRRQSRIQKPGRPSLIVKLKVRTSSSEPVTEKQRQHPENQNDQERSETLTRPVAEPAIPVSRPGEEDIAESLITDRVPKESHEPAQNQVQKRELDKNQELAEAIEKFRDAGEEVVNVQMKKRMEGWNQAHNEMLQLSNERLEYCARLREWNEELRVRVSEREKRIGELEGEKEQWTEVEKGLREELEQKDNAIVKWKAKWNGVKAFVITGGSEDENGE
ncbi:hypothetical protein P154DRAFT_571509 [Amniculicola lignicola CBS 123094]|uniref:Uncharacterized protein n=1 Tax=Amniculicola lignicola CBS 123094 TaxID=1392246 RepID=A0A6A5WU09_9PLEO|nr:hypothetical protein P154DRAFT_571509 [Amniculicola lignicola CBS 123094]